MTTNNPEINQKFLGDLKLKLEQMENQQNKNKDSKKEQRDKGKLADSQEEKKHEILIQDSSAAEFMQNNNFNYNDREELQDGVPDHDSLYTEESYWSLQSESDE